MVRELVLWKSGVPIFQPLGGKGREQISAKAMSSSWTKNESSYNSKKKGGLRNPISEKNLNFFQKRFIARQSVGL